MASCDDQILDAHEILHDATIAAAHHANRAAPRKSPDCGAHALRDHGVLRSVDDRSHRAVIVEEDRRTTSAEPPGEFVAVTQGVGQRGVLAAAVIAVA